MIKSVILVKNTKMKIGRILTDIFENIDEEKLNAEVHIRYMTNNDKHLVNCFLNAYYSMPKLYNIKTKEELLEQEDACDIIFENFVGTNGSVGFKYEIYLK